MTQAYADRRVQRPAWWPADHEWSATTINNLERGRLDEFFILMRTWKAATEVSAVHQKAAIATKLQSRSGIFPIFDTLMYYATTAC